MTVPMYAPGFIGVIAVLIPIAIAFLMLFFWIDVWKAFRLYNRINNPDRLREEPTVRSART